MYNKSTWQDKILEEDIDDNTESKPHKNITSNSTHNLNLNRSDQDSTLMININQENINETRIRNINWFNNVSDSKDNDEKENNEDEEYKSPSFSLEEKKLITTISILTSPIEYISTILTYSVNYSCIWRFPYYFNICGGAVFFIPFVIIFFCSSLPTLVLESAIGQIFKGGPSKIYSVLKQKLFGLGLVSLFSGLFISMYYSAITAWNIYLLFNSLKSPMPWDYKVNSNNTTDSSHIRTTPFFAEKIISDDWINNSNAISETSLGSINTSLFACWFISWSLIFTINFIGLKINSRFLYITSILPLCLIVILFINSFTLPFGINKGLYYFTIPKLLKLFDYKQWLYSANQTYFLLQIGVGANINFSSKKPENEDIYKRSLTMSLISLITGVWCTFITSVYSGFICIDMDIDSFDNLPFHKSELPLLIYPLALGMMRYNHFWSVLFFGTMVIMSLQSQMILFEKFSSYISEVITENYLSNDKCNLFLCIICFCFSIPFITENGFVWLEWVDKYATWIPLLWVVFVEGLMVMRHIGINILKEIVANKTGMVLPGYVLLGSALVTPLVLIVLMVLAFIYHLGHWPSVISIFVLQWIMMWMPFLLIFIFVVQIGKGKKTVNSELNEYEEYYHSSQQDSDSFTEEDKEKRPLKEEIEMKEL